MKESKIAFGRFTPPPSMVGRALEIKMANLEIANQMAESYGTQFVQPPCVATFFCSP